MEITDKSSMVMSSIIRYHFNYNLTYPHLIVYKLKLLQDAWMHFIHVSLLITL